MPDPTHDVTPEEARKLADNNQLKVYSPWLDAVRVALRSLAAQVERLTAERDALSNSYVRNCNVSVRTGDGPPLFEQIGDAIITRLDSYTIMPKEHATALAAERDALRAGLAEAREQLEQGYEVELRSSDMSCHLCSENWQHWAGSPPRHKPNCLIARIDALLTKEAEHVG